MQNTCDFIRIVISTLLLASTLLHAAKVGNVEVVDYEETVLKNDNEFLQNKRIVIVALDPTSENEPVKVIENLNQLQESVEKLNEATSDYQLQLFAIKSKSFGNKYGLLKFPHVFFFRDGNFVQFKGDMNNVDKLTEWLEETREKKTHTLTDATFEHDTQSSTGATTGDWFVLFHDTGCKTKSFIEPFWELAAIKLTNQVNLAYVDLGKNPKLQERFHIFNSPTVYFFRHGFLYRYDIGKFDVESLVSFTTKNWYKNVKAEKVPKELTWFDNTIDTAVNFLKQKSAATVNAIVAVVSVGFLLLVYILYRIYCKPTPEKKLLDSTMYGIKLD